MPSAFAAVNVVALVWLAIGLVTLAAVAAVLVALVRHVLIVGRAARQLARELGGVSEEISSLRGPGRPSRGRR